MNVKRYFLASLAFFVFLFLVQWLVNGILLKALYIQTPQVWRDMTDMASKMPLYIVFLILLSLWLTFVFTRLFREGGVGNGLLFGLYFGVVAGLASAAWYLWLPISATLSFAWFAAALVEKIIGGAIIGAIYKLPHSRKKG